MKISVITITCREQPRLPEMLKTLVASFGRRTHATTELEWIVVDERASFRAGGLITDEPRWAFMQGVALPEGFRISVEPPWLSQARANADKLPAHNSARGAGLAVARGQYVVFLNDCTVVTRDWVATCELIAETGQGWRVKAFVVNDMALPHDGVLKYRDHYDRLRPVKASAVPGACWGAPLAAFEKIGGFDTAYDGEDKCHDLDAVVRLERGGVAFVTTERAFCVRLRRTKTQGEITLRKESLNGARNQKLFQELLHDTGRIGPRDAAPGPGAAGPGAGEALAEGSGLVETPPSDPPSDQPPPASRTRAAEARAARVARAERNRPAARALARKARATRQGHNATPLKDGGLRPPKPLPPPVKDADVELGDIADATGFEDGEDGYDSYDEIDKATAEQTSGGPVEMTPYYPPAGLVTPSGPGDDSPFRPGWPSDDADDETAS